MCGIFGFAGNGPPLSPAHGEEALKSLRHRGPDSQGYLWGHGWGIGACRLAIVDLIAGDQPVKNERGDVVAVLNGEIYNYRELAATLKSHGHRLRSSGDTELLVHLWEEYGPEMLRQLRGMYALAVVDSRAKKLFLARDLLGKKPLYWMRGKGLLLFASELKVLRPLAQSWTVDPQALASFLTFGFVPEGSCIIHGVAKLGPGHWLELDIPTGELRHGRLPFPPFSVEPGWTLEAAAHRLEELLLEATALRLRADVPLAVFLSGGLDSGTVAALARKLGEEPQAIFVDLGDAGERTRAEATAASLGLPLEVLPCAYAPEPELLARMAEVFDEPLADPSVIPTYLLAKAAATRVKVVLNGDGGDELLAGYRRFLLAFWASSPWLRPLANLGLSVAGGIRGQPWWGRRFREGLRDDWGGYLAWGPVKFSPGDVAAILGREASLEGLGQAVKACPDTSPMNCLRALELLFFLPGDLLVKMDRATMANALEARSPFLDQEVVAFLLSLPPELLVSPFSTKVLLRRLARGLLPKAVVRGPKRGFEPPLSQWLSGPWAKEVQRVFRDPASRIRSFLRLTALEKALQQLEREDPPRYSRAVFAILTLEHWLQRWG